MQRADDTERRQGKGPASSKTKSVWLVRHGETAWSASGQHTGRTDLALTAHGRGQALGLARALARHDFALVLTSPLQRAATTARLAGFDPAEPCPDLMEWDYGVFEGRTSAEIRTERPGWSIWQSAVPEGESLAQVAERAERVIRRVEATRGDVLLFAHGHLLRILSACWLGLPAEAGRGLAFSAAAVSVLGYEHDAPVIRHWNVPAATAGALEDT